MPILKNEVGRFGVYVKTDIKLMLRLALRLALTTGLAAAFIFTVNSLQYRDQLSAVDNITGAAPLILLTGIASFLAALIWKRHRGAETSTIVFSVLSAMWALLFIPSLTGDWYPMSQMSTQQESAPDLTLYAPFANNTLAAKLPSAASLSITENLPTLDGATALYPVYASFANSVYDKAACTPETVLCTKTINAFQRVIDGDCDIVFLMEVSEKQKQAAIDAGSGLVYTPIGREAFVFLVSDENPIDGLSSQQIKNIYSGKTAYWRTLGWGGGGKMIVYQRQEGSGSQTGLQSVMRGLPIQKMQPLPDDSLIGTGSMMKQVSVEWRGVHPAIGYSYRFYATAMFPNPDVKMLAIDGVYPSNETVANALYPFTVNFYAVTNGQPAGNVKQLIEWVLSDEGQYLVEWTGYAKIGR